MDLATTAADTAFCDEVRAFLDAKLPREMRHKHSSLVNQSKEATLFWQRVLGEKGWMVPSWPVEHGGTGWTLKQHQIFNAECVMAGAPAVSSFGVVMVGPVIYTFGTAEQKARHLPGIRAGTTLWCQGYSEPGSGSDLASLKTRAVRRGDTYVVNGQKIWTTQAHWADWIFCLVRTDPEAKKQEGISFLLIDMKTPGIEVRPILTIDGQHHLNEVYFSDVEVPVANRIGEENKGWTYAKFLLGHERTASAGATRTRGAIDTLKAIARAGGHFSEAPALAPEITRRIAELEIRATALAFTEARSIDAADGSETAIRTSLPLKLIGTELYQDVSELFFQIAGYHAMPRGTEQPDLGGSNAPDLHGTGPGAMTSYLFNRASTIYGGTSEIQKNIMAKMVLGL